MFQFEDGTQSIAHDHGCRAIEGESDLDDFEAFLVDTASVRALIGEYAPVAWKDRQHNSGVAASFAFTRGGRQKIVNDLRELDERR